MCAKFRLYFLVSAFCILHSSFLFAQFPSWWLVRGAVDPRLPPNDYAPITCGQLKWMALNAYYEMESYFGAGANVTSLISTFPITNNYFPNVSHGYLANIGQVKYVAQPFYDRLHEFNLTNTFPANMPGYYPWGNFSPTNDYAVANIGQVKYAFSFDSAVDSDDDGLSDWLEAKLGTNPYNPDTDGDGLSDKWEVEHGTDPTVFGDVVPPVITVTSPTVFPTWYTTNQVFTIAGTASDNVGVAQVAWTNDRGGFGVCSGTTAWSQAGIALFYGTNTITVTARDVNSNSASDTLTVLAGLIPTAGLKLWVKADTGITKDTNGFVGAWADQSGNGYNFLQSIYAGYKPLWQTNRLNGRPALKFDGVNDFMTNTLSPTGQVTVFVVRRYQAFVVAKQFLLSCHQTNTPDGGFCFGSGGLVAPYNRQALVSGLGGTWASGVNTQDIGVLTTNWAVDTLRISEGRTEFWTDDALKTNDAAHGAMAVGRTLTLGENAGMAGIQNFFNGEVAEIMVYNRALADGERLLVKDSLGEKYNRLPLVEAGSNVTLCLPVSASLNGTAVDDGYPKSGALTSVWSKVSGPGEVAFGNSAQPATTASFSTSGVYVLRLTAWDGALTASDELSVTVSQDAMAANIPTAGLKLWVKADTGITKDTNGFVGAWADQSGNGYNFLQSIY
ncbi:MAG: hypothetical protein WC567_04695, partial [Kiritimatiellia bacterium]